MKSESFDNFLGVYVELPRDDKESKVLACTKELKRDHGGSLTGTSNDNPILNIEVYNIETLAGYKVEYTANVIAKNQHSQVYSDGYKYSMLYEIFGHRNTYDAIPMEITHY